MEASEHTWAMFIKCADILSDGDLEGAELRYYEKQYKRLSIACCPDIKEVHTERRIERNRARDEHMKKLLSKKGCPSCNGKLKQTRRGSKTVKCLECGLKFKAVRKK